MIPILIAFFFGLLSVVLDQQMLFDKTEAKCVQQTASSSVQITDDYQHALRNFLSQITNLFLASLASFSMPQPPSAPPEVFDADTITINSEPPPYTERDRTLSLSSNEKIEERKRRKRQKNARLKMRCFKCLAIFLACVISSISIA